jgi:hypothetical protein
MSGRGGRELAGEHYVGVGGLNIPHPKLLWWHDLQFLRRRRRPATVLARCSSFGKQSPRRVPGPGISCARGRGRVCLDDGGWDGRWQGRHVGGKDAETLRMMPPSTVSTVHTGYGLATMSAWKWSRLADPLQLHHWHREEDEMHVEEKMATSGYMGVASRG